MAEIKQNLDNGALERDGQDHHGSLAKELRFDAEQRLVLDERHTSEYDQPFGSVVRERREQIYLDKGRIVRWVVDGSAKADADDAERRETEEALGELMSEVMSQHV